MLPYSVLRRVLMWSVLMAAYSTLAVWKESGEYERYADVPPGLEAALSVAFGLLLAFRVNRAFDRWWEGRILWGSLVNACRNFAVKAAAVLTSRDASVDRLRQLLIAYPYALKSHLRGGVDADRLELDAGERIEAQHVPSAIVTRLYSIMNVWKEEGRIHYGEFRMLDRESKLLLDVCGSCERIRDTPIAPSYRTILSHAIVLYMLSLPWGIVNQFGWWTIPLVFVATYFIIGAQSLADHIEHPFVNDGDGLQLGRICQSIETSVNEIFDAPQLQVATKSETAVAAP